MKLFTAAFIIVSVGSSVFGQSSKMQKLRELKLRDWAALEAMEAASSGFTAQAVTNSFQPCLNGVAAGTYPCKNIDLYGYLTQQQLGSSRGTGNDVWGWTSPDGREIAVIAQYDGTAFAEVLSDGSLKYLGRLNTPTTGSSWRDVKVIDGYALIGTEASGSGLQIFDLRKVLTLTSPRAFALTEVTARFTGFGNSHNVVAHESRKIIYAVGSSACRGGLVAVNITNPSAPVQAGCYSAQGYTHDAQCVTYRGPDARYTGRPLCFSFNEDTLAITDHSDEANVVLISNTGYPQAAYTHQGWFATDDQRYLILDDELDEQEGTSGSPNKATTYVWDVSNLRAPVLTGTYTHVANSIDHNAYVHNGYAYHANYGSGLRVVDVRNVAQGPSTFREVAYFDVYPSGDPVSFVGAWSSYPFFKSGYVIVNTISNGAFSVKRTDI